MDYKVFMTIKEIKDTWGEKPEIVSYVKKTKEKGGVVSMRYLNGIPSKNMKRAIHRHVGLNQFERKITKVPEEYVKERKKQNDKSYKKYYFDPERTPIKPKTVSEFENGWNMYGIHDNGGTPFIVYISPDNREISVYKIPIENFVPERLYEDDYNDKRMMFYTKRLVNIRPKKIFVGKSPKNAMTTFSGGYGKRFYGNTILVSLGKNKYMLISGNISIFKSLSPIVKYVSPVGNNDVPYPFAVDEQGNYYLLGFSIIIEDFPENYLLKPSECGCDKKRELAKQDPYGYYDEMKNKDESKIKRINILDTIINTEVY